MKNSTINKIKALLGMEVSLEMMKLADGTTVLEADAFEMDNEVFVVTPDEQKIPLPVGEYELENGMILVVEVEGIIKEVKEAVVEEVAPEAEVEVEVEAEAAPVTPTAKKTVESIVKETFFSEIEALKNENTELKAKLESLSKVEEVAVEATELSEEPKPISFNPENTNTVEMMKFAKNRSRTTLDSIFEKLNK
jgi:hypothetical protein